jgi:N utilization substance protein B
MSAAGSAPFSRQARVRARRSAVQALYQWDLAGGDMQGIIGEFARERAELRKADEDYFREILNGVARHRPALQEEIGRHSERSVAALDPVERAVLYLGAWELMFRPEIPWRAVVNESVELAKMFGAEQSHRFVNGVLDAMARRVRPHEAGA